MRAVVQPPEKIIRDAVVRRAIEYLDSSTSYREFLPRQHQAQTNPYRRSPKRKSDVEDFLLVFLPIFLIAMAILAVVYY